MRSLILACLATSAYAGPSNHVASAPPVSMVGSWHVVGCETSPQDPAPCAKGTIVFTSDHVTIHVNEVDATPHAYVVVSTAPDRVVVRIDKAESEITLDKNGAHWWPPGTGGRVHHLSFVRDQ